MTNEAIVSVYCVEKEISNLVPCNAQKMGLVEKEIEMLMKMICCMLCSFFFFCNIEEL